MENIKIVKIKENKDLLEEAALWFHKKWGIPLEAYKESMLDSLNDVKVPDWYVVLDGNKIIGGLGVIENDFHERKDLSPNVCAVFVEDEYRCRGIAGKMLNYVCKDYKNKGIDTLYLVTNHIGFYERYGWTYLCPVMCDGEDAPSRMYIHR